MTSVISKLALGNVPGLLPPLCLLPAVLPAPPLVPFVPPASPPCAFVLFPLSSKVGEWSPRRWRFLWASPSRQQHTPPPGRAGRPTGTGIKLASLAHTPSWEEGQVGQEAGPLQHKQTAEPSPKDPNSRCASSARPPGPAPAPAQQNRPLPARRDPAKKTRPGGR